MNQITKTIKENEEEFRKVRTDAISEMFDNPKDGIYPTTKFFNVIDDNFHQSQLRLISAFKEMIKELQVKVSDPDSEYINKLPQIQILDELQDLLSSLTQEDNN